MAGAFVCSSLDQYYSTSTPNFAVGRARRRAVAGAGGDARQRRAMGDASSEPEITMTVSAVTATPSPTDLAMRSDTLQSPRVSPLLWIQRCLLPSLVVTSDGGMQRKRGK